MKTILIIDDNYEYCKLYEMMLSDLNKKYKLDCTTSYNEAISHLKNDSENYEIVIVDYYLPYTNGIDIIKLLKNINKNLKFIIVSGNDENFIKEKLNENKMNFVKVFTKPLFYKTLKNAILENYI